MRANYGSQAVNFITASSKKDLGKINQRGGGAELAAGTCRRAPRAPGEASALRVEKS